MNVKADEPNDAPNKVLGGRAQGVNSQDQIVQSGKYCCSFFSMTSMNENKTLPSKDYHKSYSNHMFKPHRPLRE